MNSPQNRHQPEHSTPADTAKSDQGRITSTELLQGKQQVEIEHGNDVYRLRLTRSGKLILTK